jgi:hypothetical protein
MTGRPDYLRPLALAARPLYAPLADALIASGDRLPSLMRLNQIVHQVAGPLRTGQGAPLRFVTPGPQHQAYERAVAEAGEVATRDENWHDYFNALVWAHFPRAKAALNARHMHEIAHASGAGRKGRGQVRDALTQFDECGMVVLGAEPACLEALARHDWLDAFWTGRSTLLSSTRFILFGHATYDQLRTPFPGLCAKALYLTVPAALIQAPVAEQVGRVDRWLAHRLGDADSPLSPQDFSPLPLLGIPDVVLENARRDYYADTGQFRPLGGRRPAPVHSWRPRRVEAL